MRSIDGDVATAAQAVVALVAEGLGVERGPVVIGIDGPSGSGKTTLADAVAGHLRCPVVHLDSGAGGRGLREHGASSG